MLIEGGRLLKDQRMASDSGHSERRGAEPVDQLKHYLLVASHLGAGTGQPRLSKRAKGAPRMASQWLPTGNTPFHHCIAPRQKYFWFPYSAHPKLSLLTGTTFGCHLSVTCHLSCKHGSRSTRPLTSTLSKVADCKKVFCSPRRVAQPLTVS